MTVRQKIMQNDGFAYTLTIADNFFEMIDLEAFLSEIRLDLDGNLDALIPLETVAPHRLHEAVRWSIFAGGKRIRPAILIAAGRVFGASKADLLTCAAAVEMIHTYSLIHDDLPAMDNDDLRRGRATCHKQFGEATAILAGDVLQTLAFKAIVDEDLLPADTRVNLISMIVDAAGTPFGMVAGQQMDLDAEGKKLTVEDLEQIHRRKTGALISVAAMAGAVIGGANGSELVAMQGYASKLGLLFQITDDLLDVTQKTETLGKTAGKDRTAEKATYPGHYGVEKTREMAGTIRDEACKALVIIKGDTTFLHGLADLIVNRIR